METVIYAASVIFARPGIFARERVGNSNALLKQLPPPILGERTTVWAPPLFAIARELLSACMQLSHESMANLLRLHRAEAIRKFSG